MIIEKIVEHITRIHRLDVSRITSALQNCKGMGLLRKQDLMQLTEAGIPVCKIIANIHGVSMREAVDMIEKRKITYDDTCCVLAIWAQHLVTMP